MSEERSHFAQRIDERKFSLTRRGYDKREVRAYLEDLEQAFRELEGHARRTSQRVADLERDLADARATEKVSVDNAMMAVFDAKDRILERARRRADEIEEQAHAEASRIKAAAITDVGAGAGSGASEIAAASAQADEIIASARREADRIRRDAEEGATRDLEAELDAVTAQLRRAHADTASAKEQLDAARKRIVELESGVNESPSGELEEKFAELESLLRAARDDNARLTKELEEKDQQIGVLEEARNTDPDGSEAALAAGEQLLAESRRAIADLEAQLADDSDGSDVQEQAESVLAAARDEAEAIKAEAEEQAEQRAAKVIAKAREEADQVRQTVATLTAQAEDARSAALRSKLEAENLVEAQRSMGEARDDIIAAANSRAEEIESEAHQSAEEIRKQAEEELAKAKADAEQMRAEAEQVATQAPSGEELAAMLEEAEHEVAISEELRLMRAELDRREQELEERERVLNARQLEEAQSRLSSLEMLTPPSVDASIPQPDDKSTVGADDDPADRLSALLEAAASSPGESSDVESREDVSVDLDGAEPRPRVAWPAPSRRADAEKRDQEPGEEDDLETEPMGELAEEDPGEGEELDEDGKPRETRYRSRSAQLPRLGNQAKSNMTTMANLRKKSHKGD